ncbi:chromatin remodeling complex subunit (Arp9), putative [Cordyceps militaris CM01]|uniref:Chromatin remodeling complex subunit (Arp9), putative n=1 Tax=Cordyceps militaris (strain CM01) TaxID=983644 RepID=G3JEE1_CORMM|nr:chromatin remodeling complex subunit (Arp9), putative [Cordyceps militaris CM01]EGX92954.1 chromatin remodeling complex subunit (Arp9), putative [Cordyceps militaris CM01]
MSSSGKWREEQILIICPGSKTTLAQLGCSELTLPTHRIPTRMFKDGDEWRPFHTYKRIKIVEGAEQEEWVEDVDSDEGAVYPIRAGHIVHMDAFLAFLDHVHGLLTTTYHNTPILLMASPQWTRPDAEGIARYVFEKTRTPALCIIHSGVATQHGLKWPNLTVIDIGYQKVDVTAIYDGRVVNHIDVGASVADDQLSGGEAFTQRLRKLLASKNFSDDMAEQLKKSNICEVLPYVATAPKLFELPVLNSSGAPPNAFSANKPLAPVAAAEASKPDSAANDEEGSDEKKGEDDGILDVAAIVTSGQTKEFLARKEKEKGKPGRKPKAQQEEAPTRTLRLPNSKRTHNTFFYEEIIQELVVPEPKQPPNEVPKENGPAGTNQTPAEGAPTVDSAAPAAPIPEGGAAPEVAVADSAAPAEVKEELKPEEPKTLATDGESAKTAEDVTSKDSSNDTPEYRPKRVKKDIEVGLERFTFADRSEIDRIVTAIYRTVQGIDDMYMRPPCWDNLVFVGNGSRLRGLKENILATLHARHIVSPSTATMFTSELPSNMATPTGTGAQTPTSSFNGAPHQLQSGGVNPLLQAATTAGLNQHQALGTPQPGSEAAGPASHHFHSQTPTSIKLAAMPNYLSEWTKAGFEESMFLGAQVAARIAFCLHSNMDTQSIEAQRMMSLSRVDYNELGPKGIRTHSMLN